ncbi:MAG: short-chain dehydrogenase [Actinomycetales bacterium mxb001]|nr:MAG: short-chain dehydrogenase [Actinomycetales bacterium mxb001]
MPTVADRSVIVVGATGGLGAPIARLLAAGGAHLTLVGRDEGRVRELGIPGTVVAVDVRKPASAGAIVAAAEQAYGGVDGIVNAAGAVAFGSVDEITDDILIDLFTLDTLAPIRLLRAAMPALRASAAAGRDPFIVHVSAVVAEQPMPGMAAYSAAKAALMAYDAAAARELRREGIRLVDARPPHTETGLATRPLSGQAPKLPEGLSPDTVASRIVDAIVAGEKDLPSTAFA